MSLILLPPQGITFEGTEQCKLLNVAAGRSKVHVTRHRSTKKRGASKKESLFLHTGDAERFGDRKVDPTNPMMVDRRQVVPAGRTDAGKKGASTSRLRVPQKDTSRYVPCDNVLFVHNHWTNHTIMQLSS